MRLFESVRFSVEEAEEQLRSRNNIGNGEKRTTLSELPSL
jgi:hypothetical protein